MKIFLSWSGEKSKLIAYSLKELLEGCIQSLNVFFSQSDIEKGEKWHFRLLQELADTNFGIVCLTKENCKAPWIYYEAGALSKQLDSNLNVLYIDLKPENVGFPLSGYQASFLSRDEIFSMIKTINNKMDKPLPLEKLNTTFSKFYPDFETRQKEIEMIKSKTENDSNSISLNDIYDIVKENRNILKEFHPLIPSISDDLNEIKKTDFSERYEKLIDKIATFSYELSTLNDEVFSSINENMVISLFVVKLKEMMKIDSILKRRIGSRVEIIESKLKISENKGKIRVKGW